MKTSTLSIAQILFGMLLMTMFIDAWSTLALGIRNVGNPDIVGISADGPTVSSIVSPFFARAPYFVIVDLKNRTSVAVPNTFKNEKHAVGVRVAQLLLDQKVGAIIGKHIGPEVYSNLVARSVLVYVGEPRTVSEAVEQYRGNQLVRAKNATVLGHYGIDMKGIVNPTLSCPGTGSSPSAPCPASGSSQSAPCPVLR